MTSCPVLVTNIPESECKTNISSECEIECQPVSTQTLPAVKIAEIEQEIEVKTREPFKEICLDDGEFFVVDEVGSSDEKGNEASSPVTVPVIEKSERATDDLPSIDTDSEKRINSNDYVPVLVTNIPESECETNISSQYEIECQPASTQTLTAVNIAEIEQEIEVKPREPFKEICLDDCEFFVVDEVGSSDEKGNEASSPVTAPAIEIVIEKSERATDDLPSIDTDSEKRINSNDDKVNDDNPQLDTTPEVKENDIAAGNLFCVDITPEIPTEKGRHLGPRYRREFDSVLTIEDKNIEASSETKQDNGNKCFNCLGDHSVANCPQPRNQQEIYKNRKVFMNEQSNKQLMNQRYHIDSNSKYDHLKPGEVSESLRNALGLRSREVPRFIYQMRIAGYPPGWMEEMKESSSGLDFVDSPTSSRSANNKVMYDLQKIVNYPGFNVPLDPYYRDDSYYLNFPPMNPAQAKELLIGNLKRNSYCLNEQTLEDISTHLEEDDMDVASNSSIEELELRRQTLLAQLQEDNEDKECSTAVEGACCPGDSKNDRNESTEEATSSSTPQSAGACCAGDSKNDRNESTEEATSPSTPKTPVTSPSQSKFVEMGTPVAIKFSPYGSLPSLDKFAANMGELELFENLPESTGSFKKIQSLLKKSQKYFQEKREKMNCK